eukprot:2370310-Rhodomonas_salina.1
MSGTDLRAAVARRILYGTGGNVPPMVLRAFCVLQKRVLLPKCPVRMLHDMRSGVESAKGVKDGEEEGGERGRKLQSSGAV